MIVISIWAAMAQGMDGIVDEVRKEQSFFFLQFSRSFLSMACFLMVVLLMPWPKRVTLGLCRSWHEILLRAMAGIGFGGLWITFAFLTFRADLVPVTVLSAINSTFAISIISLVGVIRLKVDEIRNTRSAIESIQSMVSFVAHSPEPDGYGVGEAIVQEVNRNLPCNSEGVIHTE